MEVELSGQNIWTIWKLKKKLYPTKDYFNIITSSIWENPLPHTLINTRLCKSEACCHFMKEKYHLIYWFNFYYFDHWNWTYFRFSLIYIYIYIPLRMFYVSYGSVLLLIIFSLLIFYSFLYAEGINPLSYILWNSSWSQVTGIFFTASAYTFFSLWHKWF